MSCLAAKPVVNGIEDELEGVVRVIRLDIQSDQGKSAARKFDVTGVPATLLVDGSGEVVHRASGVPSREEMVQRARSL